MKNNNFDIIFVFGSVTLIFLPIFIPFYFIIKNKRAKKEKILNDIFNEISKAYSDEEFLMDFKLNIKKDNINDLYDSYDLLIKKESELLYLKYKKIEYENIFEEFKNLFIIKEKVILHQNWDHFISKNTIEEQLLKNINVEKNNIYLEFKRLNND